MEDLNSLIDEAAATYFNIKALRPYQKLIIYNILSSQKSLLAILPTGGGKSICFQLPSLLVDGITIIAYPIVALIRDQGKTFEKTNINYTTLMGGENENKALLDILSGRSKIIITNMESLLKPKTLLLLSTLEISLLVFDEVHTIPSWGESFRSSYLRCKEVISKIKPKTILAFSATLDDDTKEKLNRFIFNEKPKLIQMNIDRENIIYHRLISLFPKKDIINILKDKKNLPSIVFVSSRREAEELAKQLSFYLKTIYYHAALSREERKEKELLFYNSDEHVMFATIAYGMGVNKKNIRSVIHYNLSKCASDYLQESGRAGRDNRLANAYVLLQRDERSELKSLFFSSECIRASLLSSMGSYLSSTCSGCDSCDGVFTDSFGYKKIVDRIKRYPYLYTKRSLINFLKRDREFKDISYNELSSALSYLIELRVVKVRFKRLKLY